MIKTEEPMTYAVDHEETSEEFTARIIATIQRRMEVLGKGVVYALED